MIVFPFFVCRQRAATIARQTFRSEPRPSGSGRPSPSWIRTQANRKQTCDTSHRCLKKMRNSELFGFGSDAAGRTGGVSPVPESRRKPSEDVFEGAARKHFLLHVLERRKSDPVPPLGAKSSGKGSLEGPPLDLLAWQEGTFPSALRRRHGKKSSSQKNSPNRNPVGIICS